MIINRETVYTKKLPWIVI